MRARLTALVLIAILGFYLVTIGWRGVLLVAEGRPVEVLLGLGVIVLPLVGAWAIWREVSFGRSTQRLARQLEAEDALPVVDLPRRPSGRIERSGAERWFNEVKVRVEGAPEDWRGWFHLAAAYDASGDRRRAREAMRRAITLHDAHDRPAPQPPG